MARFAVPCLVLIDAGSDEQAMENVNLHVQNHFMGSNISVLQDEVLDAFAFDPEVTEVHTALDDTTNWVKARAFMDEE